MTNESFQPAGLRETGERMLPALSHRTVYWEHVERYRFASGFARNNDVLDIACGEGYGTASLLKAGARSVVGVDISQESVDHAAKKYGLRTMVGSAEAIPLPDGVLDLVVSFETIEHVRQPELFLAECVRVLKPTGTLLVSTPNKPVYDQRTPDNQFHCSEMSLADFESSLSKYFSKVDLFAQCEPPPWYLRTRGFGRLAGIIRRRLNPLSMEPVTDDMRSRTADLCAQALPYVARLVTPEAVKRVSRPALERACYIVAAATGPRANRAAT